ncbi:MAG: cell division protein FtsX [Pseudomonadota bacterium]
MRLGLRATRLRRAPRTDLALARDDARAYVPSIVALMVFLAALAAAGALALSSAAARWQAGLAGRLTVEIAPAPAGESPAPERLAASLDLLRSTPGVKGAEPLSRERMAALLEPWLGRGGLGDDLPVPQLIDVSLAPGAAIDISALDARLAVIVPGASVDDHGSWRDGLVRLARLAVALALGVVGLVGLAAAAAVVFATRAGLAVHHEAIDLLHLMGAEDDYIARQFAGEALRLAFKGGLVGLLLAVAILLALGHLSQAIDPFLLPRLRLGLGDWALLALLPAATALLAMATARRTVLRALRHLV